MPVRVTVEARCADRQAEAEQLARAAQGDLGIGKVGQDEIRVVLLEGSAELWDHRSRNKGLPIGFHDIDLRTGTGNLSRRQPLARAMGPQAHHILDATGGFGHDAALLACMGWHVTCVERIPALATVLELALYEASRSPNLQEALGDRLSLMRGDSRDVLDQGTVSVDVVYLDPMFEPRKRSALPRKPAQLLHRLATCDEDAHLLLQAARKAVHRVVVKRPDDGDPLCPDPDLSFKARLVRYDVYLQPDGGPVE